MIRTFMTSYGLRGLMQKLVFGFKHQWENAIFYQVGAETSSISICPSWTLMHAALFVFVNLFKTAFHIVAVFETIMRERYNCLLEGQCYHYSSNSVLERRGGCLWKAGEVSRKGGGHVMAFQAFTPHLISLFHFTTRTHRDSHMIKSFACLFLDPCLDSCSKHLLIIKTESYRQLHIF